MTGLGLHGHGSESTIQVKTFVVDGLPALVEPSSCWQLPSLVQKLKQLTTAIAEM